MARRSEVPAPLENARRRFERWRRTSRPKSRIPEPLWQAAASMAEQYGLHRTARVLRLDYYSLKKRLDARAASRAAASPPDAAVGSPFIELPPAAAPVAGECIVELEDGSGAKMRIQLKGAAPPDLAALSRSFWRSES